MSKVAMVGSAIGILAMIGCADDNQNDPERRSLSEPTTTPAQTSSLPQPTTAGVFDPHAWYLPLLDHLGVVSAGELDDILTAWTTSDQNSITSVLDAAAAWRDQIEITGESVVVMRQPPFVGFSAVHGELIEAFGNLHAAAAEIEAAIEATGPCRLQPGAPCRVVDHDRLRAAVESFEQAGTEVRDVLQRARGLVTASSATTG